MGELTFIPSIPRNVSEFCMKHLCTPKDIQDSLFQIFEDYPGSATMFLGRLKAGEVSGSTWNPGPKCCLFGICALLTGERHGSTLSDRFRRKYNLKTIPLAENLIFHIRTGYTPKNNQLCEELAQLTEKWLKSLE